MRHLYVHVPFCRRRCSYCDFAIAVRRQVPADRFAAAVRQEAALRLAGGEWSREPLETLYFGGGTPSLLQPSVLAQLVRGLVEDWDGPSDEPPLELTIEVNPEDVTPSAAAVWASASVNRVSLGVQSFAPGVLAWMHRLHDPEAAVRAVGVLRDAGIGSISLDLIFGLPSELGHDFGADLERALGLEPDHLSVYGLTVEPRTPLGRWVSRGGSSPAPESRYEQEFLLAHERLVAAGFEHYEVSNYGRPGHHSRHNWAYWTGGAYLGLGPSAHSFTGAERRWNLAPWAAYERALAAGADPTESTERLTADQQHLETVYLGLRTSRGAAIALPAPAPPPIESAMAAGWLTADQGRVRLTPAGWLRLDSLVPLLTTSTRSG